MFALNEGIEGCTVLANREYLGDILSSQNFTMSVSATINPGLSEYFPWLSSVAKNYTQYRFRSLMFHYKSTSGALTTTQALGQIIGSANYNVYEAEPTTKSQLLNTIFAQSTVPSEDCNFAIECEPSQTVTGGLLYVRGGTPAQGDLRLYDLGNFYLATNGMSENNVKMGELWISYEIELYKPQLPSNSIGGTNLTIISNNAYTNAAPLGSGTQNITQNDLGLTVSGTVITFPELAQGTYLIAIYWTGSVNATIAQPTITPDANFTSAGTTYVAPRGAYTARDYSLNMLQTLQPSTTPATITIAGDGTLPGSGSNITIRICAA